MAHSQGGLITSRALKHVTERLRAEGLSTAQIHERLGLVHAETFGAAAYHYPDGPQYEHFINTSDPVPRLAGLGKSTRRDRNAGAGAEVHRFRDNKASRGDLFGSHDFDLYLEHRERIQQDQAAAGGVHVTPSGGTGTSDGEGALAPKPSEQQAPQGGTNQGDKSAAARAAADVTDTAWSKELPPSPKDFE